MDLERTSQRAARAGVACPYQVKVKVVGLEILKGAVQSSLDVLRVVVCVPKLAGDLAPVRPYDFQRWYY